MIGARQARVTKNVNTLQQCGQQKSRTIRSPPIPVIANIDNGHGPPLQSGKGMGLIWDIVVGILGAFLGFWLAGLVGLAVTNIVVEILVAFVGACILLFLFRMIFRRGMVRT